MVGMWSVNQINSGLYVVGIKAVGMWSVCGQWSVKFPVVSMWLVNQIVHYY